MPNGRGAILALLGLLLLCIFKCDFMISGDLLKNTAGMIDTLLDLENDLCVSWATENFIGSLLEATEQIG